MRQTLNSEIMDLHEKFVKLGKEKNSLTRKLCALLPEIDRQKIYKEKGFDSIFSYAWRLAGLSTNLVKKSLNLDKNLRKKPKLKEAIKTAGIHKVALVAKIATSKTDKLWAKKVKIMSKNSLQQLVKEIRGSDKHPDEIDVKTVITTKRNDLQISLDQEMEFLFYKLKKKMGKEISNKEALRRMLKKLEKSEAQEGRSSKGENAPRKNLSSRRNQKQTRHIPKQIKDSQISVYKGKCAYPNCNKPFDELHHRERFSEGGKHESIIPLCHVHHEFAHHNLIENENLESTNWKLRPLAKITENSADEKFVMRRAEMMLG